MIQVKTFGRDDAAEIEAIKSRDEARAVLQGTATEDDTALKSLTRMNGALQGFSEDLGRWVLMCDEQDGSAVLISDNAYFGFV